MTQDAGEQWPVVEYTLQRDDGSSTTKRVEPGETQKLDPRWKLRPVACMVNMESRLEYGL